MSPYFIFLFLRQCQMVQEFTSLLRIEQRVRLGEWTCTDRSGHSDYKHHAALNIIQNNVVLKMIKNDGDKTELNLSLNYFYDFVLVTAKYESFVFCMLTIHGWERERDTSLTWSSNGQRFWLISSEPLFENDNACGSSENRIIPINRIYRFELFYRSSHFFCLPLINTNMLYGKWGKSTFKDVHWCQQSACFLFELHFQIKPEVCGWWTQECLR